MYCDGQSDVDDFDALLLSDGQEYSFEEWYRLLTAGGEEGGPLVVARKGVEDVKWGDDGV